MWIVVLMSWRQKWLRVCYSAWWPNINASSLEMKNQFGLLRCCCEGDGLFLQRYIYSMYSTQLERSSAEFQKQVNFKCLALTRFYSSDVCIKVERCHNVKLYSILCQSWVQSAPNKVQSTPSPECSSGSGVSVSSLDKLNCTLQSRTPYQCVNTLHAQEKTKACTGCSQHKHTYRPDDRGYRGSYVDLDWCDTWCAVNDTIAADASSLSALHCCRSKVSTLPLL